VTKTLTATLGGIARKSLLIELAVSEVLVISIGLKSRKLGLSEDGISSKKPCLGAFVETAAREKKKGVGDLG